MSLSLRSLFFVPRPSDTRSVARRPNTFSVARRPNTRRKPVIAALVVSAALGLSACEPVSMVIGAGAAAGVAAYQERGIQGAASDLKIEAGIISAWLQVDHTMAAKIGVEVYEGRAMLTGIVEDPAFRADVVRLAWSVDGLRDVINEIRVSADSGALDLARDTWITTQLKSKLTFDERILAINYAVETVGGMVYLIGIAQNQVELDRAINHARSISYVRKVVSHVRVKK